MNNKLIPRLRFKEFSGGWEENRIKDISKIVRGASPRPIKDPKWFSKNSNVGWLRISDVTSQNGRIHYIKQKISKLGEEKTRVIKTPHLILSIAATVGEPAINYVKTGIHDGFVIFKDPEFNIAFMFQWLKMFKPFWTKYGQSGSQVNLNSNIINNQEINIPSLNEQQKIGSFFAKLDQLIELQNKKIEQLKKLKRGYLQKIFPQKGENVPRLRFDFTDNWKINKISNLYKITMGQSPHSKNYTTDNKYEILIQGNADIFNGKINPRIFTKEVTKESYYDEIILTVRAPVGEVAINQYNKVVIGRGVASIKPGNLFLYYLLNLLRNNGFWNKISSGSTFQSINSHDINNVIINIPEINEQNKIGELLYKVDRFINYENYKLYQFKQLKKAYLQEMFC
ncbi:hypothetical protein WR164_01830 [Philodulcilactobacillus myokoensis]|uniref:Type I restriction modification DNA specificity domain-containing protein n=1 Tax=Philodulcilactobacillus myokoensis TaxID=2929573 RepID=A0A9W6AYZ9_9LACO|nr:restriction endonuclease subunit S [Philodulcilactobacillus myokoensis]GLB46204.1 hypothetical protein WR164_01830 [Philodulcilactobacillus myokoensis]